MQSVAQEEGDAIKITRGIDNNWQKVLSPPHPHPRRHVALQTEGERLSADSLAPDLNRANSTGMGIVGGVFFWGGQGWHL